MSGLTPHETGTLFAPLAGYARLGLAVSGGPDSLALMLLSHRWSRAIRGPELFVYSVNHRLRPEAEAEATMVVREATRLGLPARVLRWEGAKPDAGLQAAARTARYRLIGEAMAVDDVPILVTAHHLADQAETVLMRLAHGSGVEGLRGMDALSVVEDCQIYRPLLGVHPDRLRAIVIEAGLVPALDPSNADTDYERVRWRQMLPALEALGLSIERLGVFARRMDEAGRVIADTVEAAYPLLVTPVSGTRAQLPHGRFAAMPAAVASQILGQVLQFASGERRPPPLAALESLTRKLLITAPMKATTLSGCKISSDGETIDVMRESARRAPGNRAKSETTH